MCQCCRVAVLQCCSQHFHQAADQPKTTQATQCCGKVHNWFIIFLFFLGFFFVIFFVLFALPLPAISRASLHSDSLPDGSGNWLRAPPAAAPHLWALFACPTLVASLSTLHSLSLGFSLKSSSSSASVPARLPGFLSSLKCVSTLDWLRLFASFCQLGVIYIFFLCFFW